MILYSFTSAKPQTLYSAASRPSRFSGRYPSADIIVSCLQIPCVANCYQFYSVHRYVSSLFPCVNAVCFCVFCQIPKRSCFDTDYSFAWHPRKGTWNDIDWTTVLGEKVIVDSRNFGRRGSPTSSC